MFPPFVAPIHVDPESRTPHELVLVLCVSGTRFEACSQHLPDWPGGAPGAVRQLPAPRKPPEHPHQTAQAHGAQPGARPGGRLRRLASQKRLQPLHWWVLFFFSFFAFICNNFRKTKICFFLVEFFNILYVKSDSSFFFMKPYKLAVSLIFTCS